MDSKAHELTVKAPRLREIQGPENEPFRKAIIPLDGRLITAEDPLIVGKNFRTLTNMRYGERAPKSIAGMTKINTSVLDATYLKARNAFQFRKVQPAETTTEETHVLAQAWNTGLTASKVYENTTAPPAQGNFSATAVWEDSSGAGVGRFSDAPNGMLAYCNGVDTCLWGGDGIPCTAFITSTADVTTVPTNPRDYSDAMLNTQQDGANVAVIGGGIDSYVGLMLHCDGTDASTTFTDSSTAGAAKAVTALGGTDAQIDTSWAAFGTGSLLLDGTGDGLTTADHADFTPAGVFTFDKVVKFTALPAANQAMVIYSQRADVSNMAVLTLKNLGGVYSFDLMLKTAGANAYPIKDLAWTTPVVGTKYHIALIRGWGATANSWTITINGTSLGAQTSADTYPNVAAAFQIGAGAAEVISSYPPAFNDTYVKAYYYTTDYFPHFALNPAIALTGSAIGTAWQRGAPTNQRFHIDVGRTIVLTRFYYENFHSSGTATERGVQNFTLWGSNTAASFADITYGTDTGWTQLTTSQGTFDRHAAADSPDPKYIAVTNTTAYRYYAFKFADNYGDASYMGLRRIELNPVTTIAFNGWIDEIRWSSTSAGGGVARWTANFTPWARPYSSSALYWLVRSPLPLQGLKYYVSNGNLTTSTMTVKEWNGYSWQSLTISDGTASGGVSLAQTGTVSWSSTVDSSKPKYIDGNLGYWYLFSVNACDAQIYYVALDAPCQAIKDIWSGIDLNLAAMFKYTTTYTDLTRTAREDFYDSADDTTYADLSSLSAFNAGNNCVIVGFSEQILAINIGVAPDATNSTAATSVAIDYWGGSDFAEVGDVADGTSEGSISLAKSGTISWTPPDAGNVFKRTLANNATPLYYYRIRFDKGLDASTRIYYVSGIPAPKAIRGYKFPLCSQDCLMLCCNMDGKRNSVLVSAPDSAQVFNGDESFEVEFGAEEEINCGCTIFSQYGSNLFNITMFFKDREIWNLVRGMDGWTKYRVSTSNGCPAPLTLDTVIIPPIEGRSQDNRCIAIWEDFDGVYISEGRHPTCVSDDIRDLWDQTSTTKINLSYLGSHYGRVDQAKMEYHLFVATTAGSITTLDDEWVLDLRRWKWFHVDRTTGLKIQCAVSVKDAYGASYSYGFIDTGYMERLEYGTTFDGQNIVSTFQTGDFPLVEDDFLVENEIKALVPVMRAKETTTADATFTVYTDTYTTGSDFTADPTLSNYRLTMTPKGANTAPGVIHSIKGTMTTSNETTGFEPFVIGVYYQPVREHDYT